MKKLISITLALILISSFVGCKKDTANNKDASSNPDGDSVFSEGDTLKDENQTKDDNVNSSSSSNATSGNKTPSSSDTQSNSGNNDLNDDISNILISYLYCSIKISCIAVRNIYYSHIFIFFI